MTKQQDKKSAGHPKSLQKKDYVMFYYCGGSGGGACFVQQTSTGVGWSIDVNPFTVYNRKLTLRNGEFDGIALYNDTGPDLPCYAACSDQCLNICITACQNTQSSCYTTCTNTLDSCLAGCHGDPTCENSCYDSVFNCFDTCDAADASCEAACRVTCSGGTDCGCCFYNAGTPASFYIALSVDGLLDSSQIQQQGVLVNSPGPYDVEFAANKIPQPTNLSWANKIWVQTYWGSTTLVVPALLVNGIQYFTVVKHDFDVKQ